MNRSKVYVAARDESGGVTLAVEYRDDLLSNNGKRRARSWRSGPDDKPQPGPWVREVERGPLTSLPLPTGQPMPLRPMPGPRRMSDLISEFNDAHGVAGLLNRLYGQQVVAGRTIHCVWHNDRRASLSVLPDDRRVVCHSPSCWAHRDGRGRDAWDIAAKADGQEVV